MLQNTLTVWVLVLFGKGDKSEQNKPFAILLYDQTDIGVILSTMTISGQTAAEHTHVCCGCFGVWCVATNMEYNGSFFRIEVGMNV